MVGVGVIVGVRVARLSGVALRLIVLVVVGIRLAVAVGLYAREVGEVMGLDGMDVNGSSVEVWKSW
jgi:hypothetical protein